MQTKLQNKIMITAISLILSLVLLVGASFAWFTISQNPEISGMKVTLFTDQAVLVSSSGDEGTFVQCISLSDEFKYYAPLKPVSTVDGVNWFIPAYTSDGTLESLDKFEHDSMGEHENVMIYEPVYVNGVSGEIKKDAEGKEIYKELIGEAYDEAYEKGYYVSCTFYLMTELEDGCSVTLSVPDRSKENIEDWEIDQGAYGTYALGNYEINGEGTVASIDHNAQTALRVGFLIEGEGDAADRFVIYEPNADKRSSITNKPIPGALGSENYVVDYNLIGTPETGYVNYAQNMYIPTKPIGIDAFGNRGTTQIKPNDLIVQMASQWNDSELQKTVAAGKAPSSNQVMTFGKFVQSTKDLYDKCNANTDYGVHTFDGSLTMEQASGTIIVDLIKGKAQKIEMFIWIEGQDPDCWNDIASGSFVVNLEFAAQPADNK